LQTPQKTGKSVRFLHTSASFCSRTI
jgi:hypothetical protein